MDEPQSAEPPDLDNLATWEHKFQVGSELVIRIPVTSPDARSRDPLMLALRLAACGQSSPLKDMLGASSVSVEPTFRAQQLSAPLALVAHVGGCDRWAAMTVAEQSNAYSEFYGPGLEPIVLRLRAQFPALPWKEVLSEALRQLADQTPTTST